MTPRADLMQRYGTAPFEKSAGARSLIERVGMLLLNEGLIASNRSDDEERKHEHDQEYEGRREHALEQVAPAVRALCHTDVPEDPTVRLASVARDVGADFAKIAAFMPSLPGAGLGKALGGVAAGVRRAGTAVAPIASRAAGAVGGVAKSIPGAGVAGFVAKHPGAVLGAGVLGAGALGAKAINTGVGALGQEPNGPATFGGGRFGTQLAYGTNQYGQPQLGTPLL